jgi:hypothetical protein
MVITSLIPTFKKTAILLYTEDRDEILGKIV